MRKFHKKRGPRRLFIKSLAHNLILKGKIETTVPRAKELRPIVEKMVTSAKDQDLNSLRALLAKLPKVSAQKLYYEVAPKYKDRKGGYTRIVKIAGWRKRDAAPRALIEFV